MASITDWLNRLDGVRKSGDGYKAKCPTHDDRSPSLSINEGDNGIVLVTCHTGRCSFEGIRSALGLDNANEASPLPAPRPRQTEKRDAPKPQPLPKDGNGVTVYRYYFADGKDAFAVVRRDRDDGKRFSQWTPVGDGKWLSRGMPANRPLYRLPDLKGAAKVVVVEGEKCVHAILKAWPKQNVTTWAGGTNAWKKTDWSLLAGKVVSILSDADDSGRKAAQAIAQTLSSLGCDVRLGLPDGDASDDVADWLAEDKGKAKERIAKLLTPFTPSKPDQFDNALDEAVTKLDAIPSTLEANEHFEVLGLDRDSVAIRLKNGRIIKETRKALLRDETLYSIAADETWWVSVLREPMGKQQAKRLGMSLINIADHKGQRDLTRVYGRGAVRLRDGKVVYHLGDRLLIDGEECPLDSDALAETRIELGASATDAQVKAMAEAVMGYRWASEMDGRRFLGWIVAAIVGGALEWRPHIQLSAPYSVGKSWLQREVLAAICGPLLHRIADATSAALSRLTAYSALPVAVDEAEPSSEWVMDLLSLLRIASGAEGMRIRADGSNGGVMVQVPRFAALMSSTAIPKMTGADMSRHTVVRLGREVEDWPGVRDAIRSVMVHAEAVRSRIIRDAPLIVKKASEISAELSSISVDSRQALAQGALTAGWHWWGVNQLPVTSTDGGEDKRNDAVDCLNAILSVILRDPGGPGITMAKALADDKWEESVGDLYGMKFDYRGLMISCDNHGLSNAMSRTQWGKANLRSILTQLPGAARLQNPVRIGQRRVRPVVIPVDALNELGIELGSESE